MDLYEVLRRPLITEKNTMLGLQGKYMFEVARGANKLVIKQAVETIFKVDVTSVHVSNVHGKIRRMGKSVGRTASWKKAIVTLKSGQRLEIFEGA